MKNRILVNGKAQEQRHSRVPQGQPAAIKYRHALVLYQDDSAHYMAERELGRIRNEEGAIARCTWWKLADLAEAGVLAGAAFMAMRADLIMVCVDSYEGLPLPFYVWVESWSPYRRLAAGELKVLADVTETGNGTASLREYLREVARQCGMVFRAQAGERIDSPSTPPTIHTRHFPDRLNFGKRCLSPVLVS